MRAGASRAPRALLVVLAVALALAGCSGGDDEAEAPATSSAPGATGGGGGPSATAPPAPEPLPGLPAETAGFEDWLRLNDAPIPANPDAPHGEVKNVYVNRTRGELPATPGRDDPYPEGTVVVKTGSRGDDMAAIIAVMTKEKDVDPQHGDWTFVEWARTSPDARYEVLARDSICWACHAGVQDADWVFTRPG